MFTLLAAEHCRDVDALLGQPTKIAANKPVKQEAGMSCSVSIVVSGWIGQFKMLEDGRRQIVRLLLPGDLLQIRLPRTKALHWCFCTFTPSAIAQASYRSIASLADRNPAIAEALERQLLATIETQHEWIISLGRRTAIERVAHLFCELFARSAPTSSFGPAGCDLPLTQVDLADIVGLSTVHTNRVLQDLRAAGLIELRQRRLTLLDRQGLADLAMFNPDYLYHRVA